VNAFPNLDARLLVLFDGCCGFCNASIRWFLRRDHHDRLRFAPADDPRVAGILASHNLAPDPSSILVIRNAGTPLEQILTRSDAGLAMLAALPQPWPAVAATLRIVPRPLRDFGYRVVARNRNRIAGRLESCPIPTPAERAHFL
jgi:predicted DCC family thiol-disulfide oxidoreductase YuxK